MRGLYKFRFTTERGEGSGVIFATEGGRLYGGDTGSSFVGHFTEADGVISAECLMSRHYHDPGYVPMFDVDNIALNYTGRALRGGNSFRGRQRGLAGLPVQDRAEPDQRRRRAAARCGRRRTGSATGSIPSTSACSTASMPATPVS